MLTTFQWWKNLIWDGEFVKWFNVTKLFALLLFEWLTLRTSVNSQGFAAFFLDSTLSRAELSQSWVATLLYYLTLFRTRMFDFRKCGWTNHLTTLTGAGSSFFRSSLFATMSDSLSSLFKMSDHELIAISLFCWKKFVFFTCFWQFFTVFLLFMPKSESLPSLFVPLLFFKVRQNSCCSLQKSDHEQIAPLAIYKRATVSNSIPSLFTKELREQFTLFQERIAILLFRSQKQVIR